MKIPKTTDIDLVVDGHVLTVTINRPRSLNALDSIAHRELTQVWDWYAAEPGLWVAVLTGAGEKAFCVGSDIKSVEDNPNMPFWEMHGGEKGFGGLGQRFDLFKPLIAAVNGYAIGGGLDLVLACDLAVMVEDTFLSMPEPRIGAPSGFGGLERLARAVADKHAMEVALLAGRISAADAYRIGLVNKVVGRQELMSTARAWADAICESSPLAIEANKQAALKAKEVPLEVAARTPLDRTIRLWASDHNAEGRRAFIERRKPRWKVAGDDSDAK